MGYDIAPSLSVNIVHDNDLLILIESQLLKLHGTWKISDEVAGELREELLNRFNYDYIIHIENHNQVVHPDDVTDLIESVKNTTQGFCEILVRIIYPDGTIRWLEAQGRLVDPLELNDQKDQDVAEMEMHLELDSKLFRYTEMTVETGSWKWNLHTNKISFTENVFSILGIEPSAPLASWEDFLKYVYKNDRHKVGELTSVIKQSGKATTIEFRIQRGGVSSLRFLRAKAEIVITNNGTRFCIGAMHDITAEKIVKQKLEETEAITLRHKQQAEDKLRIQEELFKEAEIVGGIGSYQADLPDFQFHFSDNMYRLLGYKPYAFKPTLEFIDSISLPEDAKLIREILEAAIEKKSDYQYTRRIVHPNGQLRIITSVGRVVCNKQGEAVKIVGIARDVTQQRAYELALEQKNEERLIAKDQIDSNKDRLERSFNASPHAFAILTNIRNDANEIIDFRFQWVSKSVGQLFGREVIKLTLKEALNEDENERVVKQLIHTQETGETSVVECKYSYESKNVWISLEATKVDDDLCVSFQNISERKERELASVLAQEELDQSNKKLKKMLQSTNDELKVAHEQLQRSAQIQKRSEDLAQLGSWEFNRETNKFYWSEGMYGMFGVQPTTHLTPEIYLRHVVDEDTPAVERIINRLRTAPEPFEEIIRIRAGEQIKTVKVNGWVDFNDQGNPSKVLGIDFDISSIADSERQLKQSEAFLKSVFESLPVGISLVTAIRDSNNRITDFEIKFVNKRAELQAGFEHLVGKRLKEVFDDIISIENIQQLAQVIDQDKTVNIEFEYKKRDHVGWYSISAKKLTDDLLIVIEDITESKNIEDQIKNQAFLFTRIIESSPDIIQIVNLISWKTTYINKMLLEELGYPFAEIKEIESHKGITDLIHPEDVAKFESFAGRLSSASDNDLIEVELRIRAFDKSWQWLRTTGKILERDDIGRPTKYVSFSQNTTSARLAEDERKNHQMLVEMDKAKTVFFNNVSHEFRTPITLLLAPLDDVIKDGGNNLSKQDLDKLRLAHRNALRLQKLVNTLLDYSRIEALCGDAVFHSTDIAKFTTELAANFRSAIEQAGLEYTVNVADPQEPIYINHEMYEKIIFNLLSNAFKFTFEGKIELNLLSRENHIELQICDTGIGISNENIEKIFNRFHRVEGAKSRTHEGSGIGLSLVRELVLIHNGTISVESKEGKGTTITVILPKGISHFPSDKIIESKVKPNGLSAAAYIHEVEGWTPQDYLLPNLTDKHRAIRNENAGGDIKKYTVLLADDNADMREYLNSILVEDFNVITVENGAKVLELLRKGIKADLILSDVMMPEMNGFELLNAVKTSDHWHRIPVILISARAGEEARIEGMEHGADDYLIKPFSARELQARVNARVEIALLRNQREDLLKEVNKQLEQRVFERTKELQISHDQLQQQKQLLQRCLDAMPQLVWTADPLGKFHMFNERWYTYTGLPYELHEGDDYLKSGVIHPSQTKEVLVKLQHAMNEGIPYANETLIRNKDGEYRWHLDLVMPIKNEYGEIYMWVGTLTDVHEQFVAEKKVEEQKNLLETILNSSPNGIEVLDSVRDENSNRIIDFEWRYCNAMLKKYFGGNDLVGKRFTEEYMEGSQNSMLDKLKELMNKGGSLQFEHSFVDGNSQTFFDVSAVQLEDSVVVTLQNVSSRVSTEQDLKYLNNSLQQKNLELENLNEQLSTFAFVASHDLREPLRKIHFFANAIRQTDENVLSDKGRIYFDKVLMSIQRMNAMIEDVLKFSRANSNTEDHTLIDLNKVLTIATTDLSETIKEKGAVISCNKLPQLSGNQTQMIQLFENLISNAIKFHKPNHQPIIDITGRLLKDPISDHPQADPSREYVVIEIADNGIGFEEEYLPKIFQMFQRLHGISEYPGTGMGLAICKKIVENHGGFIEAKSEIGEGSTFSCYFPTT